MNRIANKSELKIWIKGLVYDQCSRCEYSDSCCNDCTKVKSQLAEVDEVIKYIRIEGGEE